MRREGEGKSEGEECEGGKGGRMGWYLEQDQGHTRILNFT